VVVSSYHSRDFLSEGWGEIALVGYSNVREALEKEGLIG